MGLDLDLGLEVLALLDRAPSDCGEEGALAGMSAEALTRASRSEGPQAAQDVVSRVPANPHAHYALALARYRAGRIAEALQSLGTAIDAGRGAEARLLAGLIFYNAQSFDAAETEFTRAALLDPQDPLLLYNLALTLHQQGRFAAAREAYLKVLRVNARHADARFNLAVLALFQRCSSP